MHQHVADLALMSEVRRLSEEIRGRYERVAQGHVQVPRCFLESNSHSSLWQLTRNRSLEAFRANATPMPWEPPASLALSELAALRTIEPSPPLESLQASLHNSRYGLNNTLGA